MQPAARWTRAPIVSVLASLLAALLLDSSAVLAQSTAVAENHLSLTASIEKQEYCLIPDGRTNLRIYLRLEFTNVSHEKVIVWQKSNFVDGMDITDYAAGSQPLQWPHILIDRTIPKKDEIVPPSPGEDYSILKPGRTLRTKSVVHIDLLHSKLPRNGLVNPGKYALAVTVATWFDTEDAAVVSREQWHHSGYLVSSDVKSEPVSFSVSPNPQFHDCGYND